MIVNDNMQKDYRYRCTKKPGQDFHDNFKPELTPAQMLELGVFGGYYLNDCRNEFPEEWFIKAKLSPDKKDPALNYFEVDASLPLEVWIENGWIYDEDPRGWFQWYCRYYMGRRIPGEDERQIKRWKAIVRHKGAVKKFCPPMDMTCRIKQRQVLLQWAYDSRQY